MHDRGTNGRDRIGGDARANSICGFDGNDRINARGKNDFAHGGGGADRIKGGADNDTLLGGSGGDVIRARDGVDGNDTVYGGGGSDTCYLDVGDSSLDVRTSSSPSEGRAKPRDEGPVLGTGPSAVSLTHAPRRVMPRRP